ncbi:MAG: hypothetical protein RLZZ15_2958 [Verrucomicrobiota bacterium]|jgi:raffinose/stachyose/melibiose transport system substrate-binding protein
MPPPRRLGLAALLVTVLGLAAWAGFSRAPVARAPAVATIRLGHSLLHVGVREAFTALARDYERARAAAGDPVRIELLDVPERAYRQWLRTQLVGGTAPDLVMLTPQEDDTLTGQYFVPLAEFIDEPNPWNAGTPLDGVRWRDTFLDGLEQAGFNFRLAGHYAVPLSTQTLRVFANRRLIARILAADAHTALRARLGPAGIPRTFAEFNALCAAARAHAAATGEALVPMAGYGAGTAAGSPPFFDLVFSHQTQRLGHDPAWLPRGEIQASNLNALANLLDGRVDYATPALRSGLELLRHFGRLQQPGFTQQRREDALFLFSQQRALLTVAGAPEIANFRALIADAFELAVFPLPLPGPDDPVYGRFVDGPRSELDLAPGATFGVVNYHPAAQRARAVDFLRYLTSHAANERFARLSGWMPCIVGARARPDTEVFLPRTEGYAGGPAHHFNHFEFRALFEHHQHLLYSETGGVDAFAAAMNPALRETARTALQRALRRSSQNIAQQDVLIAANHRLATAYAGTNPAAPRRLDLMIDSAVGNEADYHYFQRRAAAPPPPRPVAP